MMYFHEEQIRSSQAVRMDGGSEWRSAITESEVLPPIELTIISSKWTLELIDNTTASYKRILAKNSDGRQTRS